MARQFDAIYDMFKNAVEQNPDKTALIFEEKRFTYSDLKEQVDKLAGILAAKGMKKGDRAIIYLPHMSEWVIIWYAMHRIGLIAIPVTHFYGAEELSYIIKDCAARIVFCSDKNFPTVIESSAGSDFRSIVIVGTSDVSGIVKPPHLQETEIINMNNLMKGDAPSAPEVKIAGDDLAEFLYTGGTTGFPKGVPINHSLYLDGIFGNRKATESTIPIGTATVIQGAPLNHILGQDIGLGATLWGDTLVLLPKMDIELFLSSVDEHKVTTLVGTPTFFKMVLNHEKINDYTLSSTKYTVCAGEALPADTATRWADKAGSPMYVMYGTTETCGLVTRATAGEPFPQGTIGKVVPAKQTKIINPDTFEPVAVGEAGELLVSSDNMVTSYWNKPEETEAHFVHHDGRLWYKTGDIIRSDEDGWLFFFYCSVDQIKHKGYRVAATRVESVLLKHPLALECCVVGIPDDDVGEKIKAFVVI
jgi:long-chain acyl-CoA synthetase